MSLHGVNSLGIHHYCIVYDGSILRCDDISTFNITTVTCALSLDLRKIGFVQK